MEFDEGAGEEKGDKEHPIVNVNMVEIVHDMSWKQFSKRPISTTIFFLRLRWWEPQLKLLEIHVHFQAQLKKTIFYKYCFVIEIETIKKLDGIWRYIYIYIQSKMCLYFLFPCIEDEN